MTGPPLEYGIAMRASPGQSMMGDRHVIQPFAGGTLVAVVDGLGHGQEAAEAAGQAIAVIAQRAGESVLRLLEYCHGALKDTRGAVMSLAAFSAVDGLMTWAGVGNVEGLLLRADHMASPSYDMLLLRAGVVGQHLPPLVSSTIPLRRGDTLVLATDGIASGFWQGLSAGPAPQTMVDRLMASYATATDDALVIAARYCG